MIGARAWRRIVIGFTTALVITAIPVYAFKIYTKTDYSDFDVYHRAGIRAQQADWSRIYDVRSDGSSPFRYAPPTLPLFTPFARLTAPQARLVWYFLQLLWFGLGFYFLNRAIGRVIAAHLPQQGASFPKQTHWAITCLSLLFVFRLCLDTFTIGQVSSLMFLGFCISLEAWIAKRPWSAGAALFIPSFLKIGPGFLYGLFTAEGVRFGFKALGASVILMACAAIGLALWMGDAPHSFALWQGWLEVVTLDSSYFDASHYGSQSFKSALLRWAKAGLISSATANTLYLGLLISTCSAILLFWLLRTPTSARGRAHFFSLGLFAYLAFMPETFKYSMTCLAIPAALLLCPPVSRFTAAAFAFGALTISLAGLDIVGETLFFGSQHYSIPVLAMILLAAATWIEAHRESAASPLWLGLRSARREFQRVASAVGPWPRMPMPEADLSVSALIGLPLGRTSALSQEITKKTLEDLHTLLEQAYPEDFEILVIPYHAYEDPSINESRELRLIEEIARKRSRITILPEPKSEVKGRGAALLRGFLSSRGKMLLSCNLEQACDVSFFQDALRKIQGAEADLVRGNRRLPESRFRIPVDVLPFAYGRHRLGLIFNRILRWLLPIRTTDTHSGNWVLTRGLALRVFISQIFGNFLFDIELSLTASAQGFREQDLPITLYLEREKSGQRIQGEILELLKGAWVLGRRYRMGCYQTLAPLEAITADDWGISPAVNRGILDLAKAGVIRRVSLMANSLHLEEGLEELRAVPGVELGLHFNLTHGVPLEQSRSLPLPRSLVQTQGPNAGCYRPPSEILLQWVSRIGGPKALMRQEIRDTLSLQLSRLKELGVNTRYLDGHHHIHIIPGLIPHLADILRAEGITRVRLPYDPALWWTPKLPLAFLSWLARRNLNRCGLQYAPCFYPQKRHFMDYGLLRAHLSRNPEAEVIVHPAEVNDLHLVRYGDVYGGGRVLEYHALRMLIMEWQGDWHGEVHADS